jgi:hypothetical protein
MNAEQASNLATELRQNDQEELACEIAEAVKLAAHYESM